MIVLCYNGDAPGERAGVFFWNEPMKMIDQLRERASQLENEADTLNGTARIVAIARAAECWHIISEMLKQTIEEIEHEDSRPTDSRNPRKFA